jgi:hypothetical protein
MTDLPVNQIQLERLYRRLLTCYPAEHRRLYGEEMIGVLLAATPEGQDHPSLADAFSLFGGGLRVRLRRLLTGSPDPGWSNALALTTLIAPVLLAVLDWQQIGWFPVTSPPSSTVGWVSASFGPPPVPDRLVAVAFLLVPLVLGLLRLRRLAAVAAIAAVLWAIYGTAAVGLITNPSQSAYLVLLAVQAFALRVSPGPAHALTLITPRNLALAVPWLLGAAYLTRVIPTHYPVPLLVAEVVIAAVALAGLPALATPGGRRLFLIIVLIPLSALVSTILTSVGVQFYGLSQSAQLAALYLPPIALATVIYLLARRGADQPQAGAAA